MKKTWIIILVLAMIMTMALATACAEEESPEPETPEPEPIAADDDDDEMQKGGSGSNPLEGFAVEGGNLEEAARVGEVDDANFKGSAGMEGWQRASDLP